MKIQKRQRFILIALLTSLLFLGNGKLLAQTWENWGSSMTSLTVPSGTIKYYQLTDYIGLTSTVEVYGTLHLNLDGYILKPDVRDKYVIHINNGGKVYITNTGSHSNSTHKGSIDNGYWEQAGSNQTVLITGGIITGGTKGIVVESGGYLQMDGGNIAGNYSLGLSGITTYGSGVTVNTVYNSARADFVMNGGQIIYNKGGSGAGVMVYSPESIFTMNGGCISHNTSTGNGGGLYLYGIFHLNKGSMEYNASISAHNLGGAINMHTNAECYMGASGPVSIKGNSGYVGGGIFVEEGNCILEMNENVTIEDNTATLYGGGIGILPARGESAQNATVTISGSTIRNNTASTDGGGIGIRLAATEMGPTVTGQNVTLNLKGAIITGNTCTGGSSVGAGISFYGGTINVGASGSTSVMVKGNQANGTANNVYLASEKTFTVVGDNFDPQDFGVYTQNTGVVPVLYSETEIYLTNLINAQSLGSKYIFPDRSGYRVIKPNSTNISFTNTAENPWSTRQRAVTKSAHLDAILHDGVYEISTVEHLTAFLMYANGITMIDGNFSGTHPNINGKLMADIDMSGQYWVPIDSYNGTFDGNGHVISNLTMNRSNPETNRGMFGTTAAGAVISNVQLHDCHFGSKLDGTCYLGSIVANMNGGTLSNSLADGTLISTNSSCVMGGLVGAITGGTVHSSAAMADMTGYKMGGLVGNNGGNLYNSFTNPKFTYSGSGSEFVGGLAAENSGTIQNCYVRFSRASSLGSAKFGQIVGKTTNANVTVCYHPTTYAAGISANLVAPSSGSVSSTIYGDVVAHYLYNHSNDNLVGSTSETLCKKLNDWVTSNSGNAPWKRTTAGGSAYSATAGDINGDYPIHRYKNASDEDLYTCVASTDGVVLDYAANLDAMLTRHASNATINLYANDNTSKGTGANEMVYIDENVSLLQSNTGSAYDITAYTCQTMKTAASGRWHFLSSSLSNSGIGFTYAYDDAGFSWDPDPCGLGFTDGDDYCIMPTDIITKGGIRAFDFYCFYEPEYHWINFKRNSNSHYHMNATTVKINYNGNGTGGNGNETILVPGKGYLVSVDQEQLLQNKGTLNNGNVVLQDVTYTVRNAWAGLLGYNLLGNPYQSYLDFDEFISYSGNSGLNATKGGGEATYATYDPEIGGYVQYKRGSSRGSRSLSGLIPPHQGFLIRRTGGSERVTATFTNDMRSNSGTATFRDEQPAYPLINLMVTDDEGDSDIAVLELNRDNDEGVEKLRANTCKGWLFLHHNDDDYAILFRTAVEDYQPLWFEADEAGTYTLRWETANGEFGELTLVDNITGVKTDMLGRDSYVFEADPEQYASRFKIVIGDYKDIEENNEDGPSTSSGTFAFQMGDGIVLNGEGRLEVIDMLGRIVRTEQLQGSQSTVRKPETAGVYVLRLMGRDGVRTQKIVIR